MVVFCKRLDKVKSKEFDKEEYKPLVSKISNTAEDKAKLKLEIEIEKTEKMIQDLYDKITDPPSFEEFDPLLKKNEGS